MMKTGPAGTDPAGLDKKTEGKKMYKKAIYKYHSYCGTITDPETVKKDFLQDIAVCKPVNIRENNTRVFIAFHDSKYQILYTLPLSWKKYIVEV